VAAPAENQPRRNEEREDYFHDLNDSSIIEYAKNAKKIKRTDRFI
jgi:hypothetical protein